uniref:Integrase catalytic domain-containing protein n=1 Tax=Loa loa TaxID=7209 RepID=A0A1I7VQL9_LOALO
MWVVTPFEQPDFPSYPTARITATRPFEITGVDLFGPIIIKENQVKIKRWVALFTCLTTRAVHLEVVETMSMEQCIQAFRRFISRRKQPKHIISDNAKNLIAASKEIIELNRIEGETLEWEFITPGAPWQGGIYERMVVVKRSLKRAIGTKYLNNAELITLIVELEAIINERPLVDIEEIGLVLRPEDFLHPDSALGERLIGGKDYNRNNATANIGNSQTKELKHQYITTCKRLDHLWKIWRGEYLEELRKRAQRKHRGPRSRIRREPKIDELVLLKGDCPRNTWKMGRVHKLLRGKDGVCRSAVITANGNELVRAVGHLYPLEISSDKMEKKNTRLESVAEIASRRK